MTVQSGTWTAGRHRESLLAICIGQDSSRGARASLAKCHRELLLGCLSGSAGDQSLLVRSPVGDDVVPIIEKDRKSSFPDPDLVDCTPESLERNFSHDPAGPRFPTSRSAMVVVGRSSLSRVGLAM